MNIPITEEAKPFYRCPKDGSIVEAIEIVSGLSCNKCGDPTHQCEAPTMIEIAKCSKCGDTLGVSNA